MENHSGHSNQSNLIKLVTSNTMISRFEEVQLCSYPHFDGKKLISKSFITIEQLQSISKGFGGRAGVIPWFYNDKNEPMYFLNISNRGYVSDFGGGIRSREKIYEGFQRELSEEVPEWKDAIMLSIENEEKPPYIHCVETIYLDKQNERPGFLKFQILILCNVSPSLYNDFKPSKEVQQLLVMSHSELQAFLYDLRNHDKMNNGLRQFRDMYK